jgi:soluble lytic murein transglycosylase-like protein
MKNSLMVGRITLLFFCLWLIPSLAEACDGFEKDFVLQKLFVMQIKGNATEKTGNGFINLARRCGFDLGGEEINAIRKTRGIPPSGKSALRVHHSLDPLIKRTAYRYGVDPALVKALIHTESSFAVSAISSAGAIGLTQVMPKTALELGVRPTDLWNPHINVDTGVRYLALNIQRFGSVKKALIAYNAGPHTAAKVNRPKDLRRIPDETRGYLKRIISLYGRYRTSGFGVGNEER